MKDHIIIPLLVVCVGLPLVALGMYYLCESLPIAEDMRKREAQGIAERRQARGNDDSRTYEEEDATNRASRTNAATSNGGGKVEIKGVSINLPYEEMKQKFVGMFGKPTDDPLNLYDVSVLLPSSYDFYYREEEEKINSKACSKMIAEMEEEFKNFANALNGSVNDKNSTTWYDSVAYGGVLTINSCGGCCVDFDVDVHVDEEGKFYHGAQIDEAGRKRNSQKYYEALCKKFGTPEKLFDHISSGGNGWRWSTIYAITGEDGLIIILSDKSALLGYEEFGLSGYRFLYLNQSFLNRYKSYIPQKRERDKKREAQLQEWRKQDKQRIEQEEERVKKRDSGI